MLEVRKLPLIFFDQHENCHSYQNCVKKKQIVNNIQSRNEWNFQTANKEML